MTGEAVAIWAIALASIGCVLARPKGLPEAVWASAGAVLLVVTGLVAPGAAGAAVWKGLDVYLFLIGMMALSEMARYAGVFDWLASHAVRAAAGSRVRLFSMVYGVGIAVTVLLSNDATAVVLTPAVQAAVRSAGVEALPYLMSCAFIANAASFVLPISNPANLVVFHEGMPTLGRWLAWFTLPSVLSIGSTYILLRWLSAHALRGGLTAPSVPAPLTPSGRLTLWGIGVFAVVLLGSSARGVALGAPAFLTAAVLVGGVAWRDGGAPAAVARGVSWSVIPLVAGLFVIVEALNGAGARDLGQAALAMAARLPPLGSVLSCAFGTALLANVMNNLPAGLISGEALRAANLPMLLKGAVLIGIDLGPNLSITGSLATILWLIAIRREGSVVSFWQFLKWGAMVMPPALLLAAAALWIAG